MVSQIQFLIIIMTVFAMSNIAIFRENARFKKKDFCLLQKAKLVFRKHKKMEYIEAENPSESFGAFFLKIS